MSNAKVRRRKFLQAGATVAVATTAVSCSSEKTPWRFFTAAEALALEAVCEQIVPADADAGARQAGVVHYIDRQLMGFHRQFQGAYRRGLAALDETSRTMHRADFAAVAWSQQTALLKALETGQVPGVGWKEMPPGPFLEMVVAHSMQGFYGSPRHGGNREMVSWRMLGVPDPPVRGREQYDFTKQG